jgi:hypothetical protein
MPAVFTVRRARSSSLPELAEALDQGSKALRLAQLDASLIPMDEAAA